MLGVGDNNEKFLNQQESMLPLLAQKENRKEQSFLGRKRYRKDHPYFRERVGAGKSCMEIRTIIRLPNSTFFDIEMISKGPLDKGKPFVRRERKAAGAGQVFSMAKLPKDEPMAARLFCL